MRRLLFVLLLLAIAMPLTAQERRGGGDPPAACGEGCGGSEFNIRISSFTFAPVVRTVESGPYTYQVTVTNWGTAAAEAFLTCTGIGTDQVPCSVSPGATELAVDDTLTFTVTYSTLGVGQFSHKVKLRSSDLPTDSMNMNYITVLGSVLQSHVRPHPEQMVQPGDSLRAEFAHSSGINSGSLKLFIDGVDRTSYATTSGGVIRVGNLGGGGGLPLSSGTRSMLTYGCASNGRCDTLTTPFFFAGPATPFLDLDSLPPGEGEGQFGLLPGALPLPPDTLRGCPVAAGRPHIRLTSPFTYTSQGSSGYIFMAGVNWHDSIYIASVTIDHASGDPTTCGSYTWLDELDYDWNYWSHTDPDDPLWTHYPYGDRTGGSSIMAFSAQSADATRTRLSRPRRLSAGANPLLMQVSRVPAATRPVRRDATGLRPPRRRGQDGGTGLDSGGVMPNVVSAGAINPHSYQVWLNGTQIVTNGVGGSGVDSINLDLVGSIFVLPVTHSAVNVYDPANPSANNGGWNEVIAQISDSTGNTSRIRARFVQVGSESGVQAALVPEPLRAFDRFDQGECASFGAFQCDAVVVSQTIPGFVTRDRDRSLHLVYRSNSQRQRIPIPVRIDINRLEDAPDSMHVFATSGGGSAGSLLRYMGTVRPSGTPADEQTLWETANETRVLGAEVDALASGDGRRRVGVTVRGFFGAAQSDATTTLDLVELHLTDTLATRFGPGWQLAELSRLLIMNPTVTGQDTAAVLVSGDGSYVVFRRVGGAWVAPQGETARLVTQTSSGAAYIVYLSNGAFMGFRGSDGWQVWTRDLVGNFTRYVYSGSRLTELRDTTGYRYLFRYAGTPWVDRVVVRYQPTGDSLIVMRFDRAADGSLERIRLPRSATWTDTTQFRYAETGTSRYLDSIIDPRSTPSGPIVTTFSYDTLYWTPTAVTRPPDHTGTLAAHVRDPWRRALPRAGRGRGGSELAERTLYPNQQRGTFVSFVGLPTDYRVDRYGGPTYVRKFVGAVHGGFYITADEVRHIDRDAAGRVVKIVVGRDSSLALASSVTDSVMYEYDSLGHMVRLIQPTRQYPAPQSQMDTVLYTYSDVTVTGNRWCTRMLSSRDPAGGVTTFEYGGSGTSQCLPIRVIGLVGDTTTFTYGTLGQGHPWGVRPVRTQGPLGHVDSVAYDTRTWNSQVSVRMADNRTSRMTFTPFGLPDSVIDPMGTVTLTRYDLSGRPIRQKTGTGSLAPVTETFYNRSGLTDSVRIHAAPDIDDSPSGVIQTTRTWYNRLGWVDSTRTPGGRTTLYWRDRAGNPTFECPGNGTYVARVWDIQSRLRIEVQSQVDPQQTLCGQSFADSTTLAAYQGLGMVGGVTRHLGVTHRLEYDNAGRLSSAMTDDLVTVRRGYSGAGQLLGDTIAFDDGAQVVRRYEYNRRGQRTVVRDTIVVASGANLGGGRTEYQYDSAGRLSAQIGYRDNNTYFSSAAFYRDRGGRDTLRVQSVYGSVNWLLATRWSYNAAGIMTHSWTETPGLGTWYSFQRTSSDALDRVRSASYSEPNPTGGDPSYNYSGTATFGYDTTNGTGRLLYSAQSGTQGTSSTWTYDVLGNRLKEECAVNCSTVDTVTFGTDNRIERRLRNGTGISRFLTDRTGNRLARFDSTTAGGSLGPQELMSYTARNQLFFSMTPTASPANYDYNWHWYDASGMRVVTHVNSGAGWIPPEVPDGSTGSRTYYVYDGSDVALTLLRQGSTWSVHQRFLNGGVDQQLAVRTGGMDLAFVTDHQGSVRAAIKVNGVRETNASYWSRNAFGALQGAGAAGGVQTQTGFTGASTPNATGGFTYLRNRWYDPQTGRFLTQDPIGLAGGVNLYAYAGNNPISFSDPFGLCPEEDPDCPTTAERLSAFIRNAAAEASARVRHTLGSIGSFLQSAAPQIGRDLAIDAALAVAVPAVGEVRLGRRVAAIAEAGGQFLSESRHLRGLNEARKDFSRIGATADDVVGAIARSSGWQNLEAGAIAGGRLSVGNGTVQYTLKQVSGTAETVVNAWIPGVR